MNDQVDGIVIGTDGKEMSEGGKHIEIKGHNTRKSLNINKGKRNMTNQLNKKSSNYEQMNKFNQGHQDFNDFEVPLDSNSPKNGNKILVGGLDESTPKANGNSQNSGLFSVTTNCQTPNNLISMDSGDFEATLSKRVVDVIRKTSDTTADNSRREVEKNNTKKVAGYQNGKDSLYNKINNNNQKFSFTNDEFDLENMDSTEKNLKFNEGSKSNNLEQQQNPTSNGNTDLIPIKEMDESTDYKKKVKLNKNTRNYSAFVKESPDKKKIDKFGIKQQEIINESEKGDSINNNSNSDVKIDGMMNQVEIDKRNPKVAIDNDDEISDDWDDEGY